MLSIGVVRAAAAATSYYETDDYYAGGDGTGGGATGASGSSQWWGEGARRLGLEGTVDPARFREVLDGQMPDGVHLGTQRDGQRAHRPGWDLTFSAPKSVSITAALGGDARIVAAHDAAVQMALGWLEKNAAAFRQRHDGEVVRRQGDNLTVALFRHEVSRDQEPQLHTHAVVANATQRADGRWVSLTSEPLFDHKMVAGTIYRAELAHALRDIGYEVMTTHRDGRFEIGGVSPVLMAAFSSRRGAIEQAMEERGLEGPVAAARAALMTRRSKRELARAVLQQRWKAIAVEHAHELSLPQRPEPDMGGREPGALRESVRDAVDRLAEHEAVFGHAELLRWSLAGAMGTGTLASVDAEIRRSQRGGTLMATALDGRSAWTTPAARERERVVLAVQAAGRQAVDAIAGQGTVDRHVGGLDAGQQDAVRLIAGTRDRIVGVLGRPGTGKTRMLAAAQAVVADAGYRAVGMATNAEAARVLTAESGMTSSTLRRHLQEVGRDVAKMRHARLPWTAALLRRQYGREVWFVDEASQLGSKDARQLLTYAQTLGTRVVMVGDTAQLPAVSAGRPFGQLLAAGMAQVELDAIRRQRDPGDVAAIRDVIAGDIDAALARLADRTTEIADANGRMAGIVAEWARLDPAGRRATTVLTARNAERTLLNDRMRAVLRGEGRLVGEQGHPQLVKVGIARSEQRHAVNYRPGDVVRFGRGVDALGIEAGAYLSVREVDREFNVVTLENRDAVGTPALLWNPRELAGGAVNGVEVYRARMNSVAIGERITWTRNRPELGLTNGQVLTVLGADNHTLDVRNARGDRLRLDTRAPEGQHWDHGYATTVYRAQGRTVQHTLVHAESNRGELFSQKALLVAISRHTDSIRLFVDDAAAVATSIRRHAGEKTSARGHERGNDAKPSLEQARAQGEKAARAMLER